MNWTWLFTAFRGCIDCKQFWIGVGALVCALLGFELIWGMLLALQVLAKSPPETLPFLQAFGRVFYVSIFIVFVYPTLALISKRLNDLDRPGWMKFPFIAPWLAITLLILFNSAGMKQIRADGTFTAHPTELMRWASLLATLTCIWAAVDLGFVRGTERTNRYGEDPLADLPAAG